MKQFSKTNLPELRKSINDALSQIAEQYDIQLSIGNISFDSTTFTTKISAKVNDTLSLTQENHSFLISNGLPSNLIGKEFLFKGTNYRVNGISKSKRKYPITTIRLTDNTVMNFTVNILKSTEVSFRN